jgi:hypothetical protein
MSLWLAGYPKKPGFDVRFGSQADTCGAKTDVRFTPESGHELRLRQVENFVAVSVRSILLCLQRTHLQSGNGPPF